ncbi:MAG: hypothetical protein QOD92_1967 [Acidimicrobiaceae bacterium]|jgi:hypothetical protein
MTVDDDTPETDDEWQFAEIEPPPPTQRGGGLLQTILDEVSALRAQADADRSSLADALSSSFAKLDVELEVMREQVAALRTEVDASATQITGAFTEMLKSIAADNDVDVPAVVERAVAAQGHANVEAVVAALSAQLTALRNAVPTAETARIAMEISRLRQALIGPDRS